MEACILQKYLRILCVLFTVVLFGCTTPEHKAALVDYEHAIASKKIERITVALTRLYELDPKEYQASFKLAKQASDSYKKAKTLQASGMHYQAYLLSQKSYRTWPALESREMLVITGKKIEWLLSVEKHIKTSYNLLPENLLPLLEKYQNKKVLEWSLITINQILEQLGKSAQSLNKAISLIEKNESTSHILDNGEWHQGLLVQLRKINGLSEYLINIALYHSAEELHRVNHALFEASVEVLSQVESNLAEAEMKVSFRKAQNDYFPYTTLVENLSLASALGNGNRHATWYAEWFKLEQKTFTLVEPIETHINNHRESVKAIEFYRQASSIKMPVLEKSVIEQQSFMALHPKVSSLLSKLNQDKTLISYGLSMSEKK
ncbi:hypothetical protein [Colwellia sp. RSH04]|uniref:hypothetical protein n=1 Tax=Colwellia sp. RSH04 TaxID=2305464 RepID=UPI000E5802BD|nr:hypothetical protein [Colwellia sp. RSH04]RHW75688.1 hypothetical protein D1094_11175 [Colwellia sp. RSH04]